MQGAEALLVAREGPVAPARPAPGCPHVDRHVHGQRVLAQRLADPRRFDCPASQREHRRSLVLERRQRGRRLEHSELDLAPLLEQLRDRLPRRALELTVEVHQPPPQPLRDLHSERALPRAHEPDERDVPV